MEWTKGRTIGHGASATVSDATSRSSGHVFALKSAELWRSEPLQREHRILSALNCPYVIGYRGCEISVENGTPVFNLKLEYAPGGTVADAVRRSGGRLDVATIRRYTCRIVKGLEYLHGKGIVHCDIKGSNILVCEGGLKIADLGCAKAAGEAAIGGTPMYMAPEVARGEEQGFPADIWALGCTVIEMSTGKSPWPEAAATVSRIAFSGEVPEFPTVLSDLGKDFLGKCLRINPKERWTAKQLLGHPFLEELESPTGTPTSVLDQGVWGKIGGESSGDSVQVDWEDSLESPKQRMEELWMNSREEDWEWDESWITVRDCENVNGKIRADSVENSEGWRGELVLDNFQFL